MPIFSALQGLCDGEQGAGLLTFRHNGSVIVGFAAFGLLNRPVTYYAQ